MRTFFPLVTASVLAGVAIVACAASEEPAADTEAEALRALKPQEIIGALAYGETSAPVEYTETPLYRAYKFQGKAGDLVDVWVRSSSGGDAHAWLLRSSFSTLASNADADAQTRDAHITAKLGSTGTYYIAFREENREEATFTVSLARASSPVDAGTDSGKDSGTDAGGPAVSLWDDALATGARITQAEAAARFAPGASRATLGHFVMGQRTRTCTQTTGCTAWAYAQGVTLAYDTYELWIPGPGWSAQKSCFQFKPFTFPSVHGDLAFVLAEGGQIALELRSTATGTIACTNATSGAATCPSFASEIGAPTGGTSCNLPNPVGSGFYPDAYPSSVALFGSVDSSIGRLDLRPLVTRTYAYARSSSSSVPDSTGAYRDVEYAFYGLLAPGAEPVVATPTACVPTTCAAQGKTCGTISDGCGGTLSCGACGYPYTCSAAGRCEVPAGCNLQPCYGGASVASTCCGAGQVTCANGHGCTCYDACN
jgi:hypothetical protein